MLKFPNNGNVESFLRDAWQKNPLFMPRAIAALPSLEAEEIAWLATQSDVESRLILTEKNNGQATYRAEAGPFPAERLASLPNENWTLLVQDVDKHLPELTRVFDEFPFIPSWRIDDLMVSVAAPGGSVGPHVDNYDVFLCQLSGERNWKVALQTAALRPLPHDELQLVEPFEPFAEYTAEPGDVLYLPPGKAHWGVATSLCITYSVGMRAPTAGQLAGEFARAASDSPGLDRFYADPDLNKDEALGGRISEAALLRARRTLKALTALDDRELATLLGSALTDPKAWLAPPTIDEAQSGAAVARFCDGVPLVMHGMSRLAWSSVNGQLLVFANGFALATDTRWESTLVTISRERRLDAVAVPDLCGSSAGERLLRWLVESGIFDIDHGSDA